MISRQNRILLLKKLRDGSDYWILPKGHIEEGETAEIAALREIREETGLEPPEIAQERSQLRIVSYIGSYTTHTIKHHSVVEKVVHLVMKRCQAVISVSVNRYKHHNAPPFLLRCLTLLFTCSLLPTFLLSDTQRPCQPAKSAFPARKRRSCLPVGHRNGVKMAGPGRVGCDACGRCQDGVHSLRCCEQ